MRARTIAALFGFALFVIIARNYQPSSIDGKPRLHATICKMTNDSSKNNKRIKEGIFLEYQYDLIWCDAVYAKQLVEKAVSSNDTTKKVVFMIGGSTRRERKEHWKNNSKMHIRAKMNKISFDDDLFSDFDWNSGYKAMFRNETEGLLKEKHPNYEIMLYDKMAIHDKWINVYDPNWRVITDKAELIHNLGDEYQLFDCDLMVFVRNDATNQSVVLLSDIHCSQKIGEIQRKFIQKWKPSAASLELDFVIWRYSELAPFSKNMMSVMESEIPDTIYFSEWFYQTSPACGQIDDLERLFKELEENENQITTYDALRRKMFLFMDDAKKLAKSYKEDRIKDEKITVKVRSDTMFQSLMQLANAEQEDGSKKHEKIVGVYGLEHVMDIKSRFEGISDGFLLQLYDE